MVIFYRKVALVEETLVLPPHTLRTSTLANELGGSCAPTLALALH